MPDFFLDRYSHSPYEVQNETVQCNFITSVINKIILLWSFYSRLNYKSAGPLTPVRHTNESLERKNWLL